MNLYLAPIQGMTVAFYRNAFNRIFGGMDAYYSPFIGTTANTKIGDGLFKDLSPDFNDASVKVIPQLLGNDGAEFRVFAARVAGMGYDEINWNIGCPFPMVTCKKKGSGILPYADMIKRFLDIVCSDMAYTLTVKMRLGLEHPEEGQRVIRLLNDYPLGSVIIHARTGQQMYTGKADLDSFETLASACRHQVIYNGDIFTCEDFNRISSRFPFVTGFMIGRGALSNPFLPMAIRGQDILDLEKMIRIRQFHDALFDHYRSILSGDKHLCDRMKGFWSFMLGHIDTDSKLVKRLRKCHTVTEYLEIAGQILNSSDAWCEVYKV